MCLDVAKGSEAGSNPSSVWSMGKLMLRPWSHSLVAIVTLSNGCGRDIERSDPESPVASLGPLKRKPGRKMLLRSMSAHHS